MTAAWLNEFHDGLEILRGVIENMKYTELNLDYTFPHISSDIREDRNELQRGIGMISKSIDKHIEENIELHDQNANSCVSALLHIKET